MTKVDRFVGMAAIFGGILLAITGWRLDPGTSNLPGPGFFPLLIAGAMGALGIWLFTHPGSEEKPMPTEPPRWGAFTIALLSILVYAMVLLDAGYLCSTFSLLIVQLRWVEKRRWTTAILIAFIAAGASLIVFRVLLKVPLPAGFIPLPKGW
jgi:putative tricarboxylic transport membrane protein